MNMPNRHVRFFGNTLKLRSSRIWHQLPITSFLFNLRSAILVEVNVNVRHQRCNEIISRSYHVSYDRILRGCPQLPSSPRAGGNQSI